MTNQELNAALRRNMTETGSMMCLGCGHEHNCSTQGCAVMREAAERIDAGQWIPVIERLPETFKPVIVCRKNSGYKIEQGFLDINGTWKVYGTRTKRVTHWMPLPEPPEEG